mgnify:CR=1 FL=1
MTGIVEWAIFLGLSGVALVTAAGMLLTMSMYRAGLALMSSFVALAGLFILLDADLLAAIQIMMNVGGMLIMVLFMVMIMMDPGGEMMWEMKRSMRLRGPGALSMRMPRRPPPGDEPSSVHDRHEDGEPAALTVWTCPMHPEVREPQPGRCPICGMALVPAEPEPQLSDHTTTYTCLMHPEIRRSEPGTCPMCGMTLIAAESGEQSSTQESQAGHDDHHEEVFDPGDMRNMGGLRKTMPVTFWLYIIGTLALAGIVPFAGFWSKDEILLDASLHYPTVYILLSIAAFFTAFYMGRQIWMVFFGEPRHEAAAHAQESPLIITAPLMVLAALSLLGGALNLPFDGFHNLTHWLSHTLGEVEGLSLDWTVAGVSTALALIAIVLSWFIYGRKSLAKGQPDPLKKPLGFIFTGMENKWFVDEIYRAAFVDRYKDVSRFLADVVDWKFWHDWFHDTVIVGTYNWISNIALDRYADQKGIDRFANFLGEATQWLSATTRKVQNGFVRSYALSIMLGVVVILGYLLLK